MFFAVAFLLIQPQIVPRISFSLNDIVPTLPAAVQSSAPAPINSTPDGIAIALMSPEAEPSAEPPAPAEAAALPSEPVPVAYPFAMAFLKNPTPGTVSIERLRAEQRRKQRVWMALGIADHSAATFDAWSTRDAISNYGARELNPTLRPFAGNASLYLAIQVGPALMDYVGKRMMSSRHGFVRHMWWIPQSASLASSLLCGAHNVAVR